MKPELDKKYKVKINDCCVEGEFVATVTFMIVDHDDENYLDEIIFDNGVRLTNTAGVSFEAIE